MRIIGGTHRSRNILGPKDDTTTRPITDRVKTSLFDRLTSMAVLEGAVLDIFSGTGSLGLEALSREVDHVTFIERDRGARELLKVNLKTLGFDDKSAVLSVDALSTTWIPLLPHRPVNLIFLDPPYRMMHDEKDLPRLAELMAKLAEVTAEEGVLVLRTDDRATAPTVAGWQGPASHAYGSMVLHFYQR
jgi:16S rRNA (guanine966-N2)-methyltransferase